MKKIIKIEQPKIMTGVIQTFMSEIKTATNILKDLHNPHLTWVYVILQFKTHSLLDLINRRGPRCLHKNNRGESYWKIFFFLKFWVIADMYRWNISSKNNRQESLIFITKSVQMIVFIVIFTFWPMHSLAFFKSFMLNSGAHTELQTEPFI